MAPLKKALAAAILATAVVTRAQTDQFKVNWHYANLDCTNPPASAHFTFVTDCATVECKAVGGGTSTESICVDNMSDVPGDGSKGEFLVESFFSNGMCSGNPTEGELYILNTCLQNGVKYEIRTCSGGQAVLKSCDDSDCSSGCTVKHEYSLGTCTTSPGGLNYKYSCTDGGEPGGSSSASYLAIGATALFAVAIATVASVAF